MSVSPAHTRRSQEERSAATRERLLDATIECLVELGYSGTTTTEIVRRAGVSRGAQVHHFPTKAELVRNAVFHLAGKRHEELRQDFRRLSKDNDPVSTTVDVLWSAYAGPLFTAALELTVAARTDVALRPVLSELGARITNSVQGLCRDAFGTDSLASGAMRDAIELTGQMMHGLAMKRLLAGGQAEEEERLLSTWKETIRPLFEQATEKTTSDARSAALSEKKGKAS